METVTIMYATSQFEIHYYVVQYYVIQRRFNL